MAFSVEIPPCLGSSIWCDWFCTILSFGILGAFRICNAFAGEISIIHSVLLLPHDTFASCICESFVTATCVKFAGIWACRCGASDLLGTA